MGPEGNILVNSSISTFQQGLTHSALLQKNDDSLFKTKLFFDYKYYNTLDFCCPTLNGCVILILGIAQSGH